MIGAFAGVSDFFLVGLSLSHAGKIAGRVKPFPVTVDLAHGWLLSLLLASALGSGCLKLKTNAYGLLCGDPGSTLSGHEWSTPFPTIWLCLTGGFGWNGALGFCAAGGRHRLGLSDLPQPCVWQLISAKNCPFRPPNFPIRTTIWPAAEIQRPPLRFGWHAKSGTVSQCGPC